MTVSSERFEFAGSGRWHTMFGVGSERVQSLRPFLVLVELASGQWTALHEASEVYGAGRTLQEAREDFRASALDLFDFLTTLSPNQLGPLPAQQLRILREHLISV